MRDLLDRIRELRRIPSSEEVDQLLTEDPAFDPSA
jgi:hypothetical protein